MLYFPIIIIFLNALKHIQTLYLLKFTLGEDFKNEIWANVLVSDPKSYH